MGIPKPAIIKKWYEPVPEPLARDFNTMLNTTNMFRLRRLSIAAFFLGIVLFFIDYKLWEQGNPTHFMTLYLWFDAILAGLGLLFYALVIYYRFFPGKGQHNTSPILVTAAVFYLSWCGGVSAVEYTTHHSVSTLFIGVLTMAAGIYLRGWVVFLAYALSILTFCLGRSQLDQEILFFSRHVNLLGLFLFGWVLSRILFLNKADHFVSQKKILEKNQRLNHEITVRKKTQKELEQVHKILEQRVKERTRELETVNTELKKEIIERKKMEDSLQQARKMESLGTLAGGIAHDFNNILAPIMGHAEMLRLDLSETSPYRYSLDQIYSASLRARELVQQILTFSRQEKGQLRPIRIEPVIEEALKLIRSSIPASITIEQEIQNDCGIIRADPTQIHQIIMNLCTNAYHAMQESGGKLKIRLFTLDLTRGETIHRDMAPGTYICLNVTDTGAGMDEELITHIFDPFFSTKEVGKGTGIGLAVVHGIVTGMGGAVTVKSTPGKGSDFFLYFPLEKNKKDCLVNLTPEAIQGGSEKILLVDDEKSVALVTQKILHGLGYDVTCRTSSIEALKTFRAGPKDFDLVLTDLAMPNLSGEKLAAELIHIRPDIPVLLCTGFSEEISGEQAEEMGIKGVLMKPVSIRDLSQKIRELLSSNG